MATTDTAEVFMCRTQTGMSNVVGNMTMIIRDFIKGLFPKNFFKDEFLETQMVQTEMDTDITKKRKPCLVIRPKISLEDDDTIFGKLPDWISSNYFIYKKLRGNYYPIFKDDENKIYMYCTGDRIKITYDIEIVLDTKMQQLNTAFFLKGSVMHKSYFYLDNTRLETEVPKYYIKQIANVLNYDLSDDDERSAFNYYLNENSQKFLEEKIKLSSGNYGHFYLYQVNVLSRFTGNPDIDDGENQGMTYNNFKISETLEVDFWTPSNYFLEIGKKFQILNPRDYDYITESSEGIGLHYTMKYPIPEKFEDYDYHNKIMYITDEDPKQDVVDISQLFTPHDKQIIKFAHNRKILMSEIFHIDLYLDNYKVDPTSILIDWDNYTLTNLRPKVNDCYTLVVYKNKERYNRTQRAIDHIYKNEYN